MKRSNDNYRGYKTELREAERLAREANYVREENERFAAMTPAQKRVRIAQDVLDWMKLGRIVPTHGRYLSLRENGEERRSRVVNGYECHACALGSIFACAVERHATKRVRRNLNRLGGYIMRWHLGKFFDEEQLLEIEDAFEGFFYSKNPRAAVFCRGTKSRPKARMRRIMQNIIANDGTFVP